MTNQLYALLFAITPQFSDIKVGIRLGETEQIAVMEPFTVPTNIPAFHQHTIKSMLGGKVHIGFGVCRGSTMLRATAPGIFINVHAPPDADIFARLYPAHVTQFIWLI